jgi:hypothetical protein
VNIGSITKTPVKRSEIEACCKEQQKVALLDDEGILKIHKGLVEGFFYKKEVYFLGLEITWRRKKNKVLSFFFFLFFVYLVLAEYFYFVKLYFAKKKNQIIK